MDPTIRLRIATRIHFALLRHYGEDVAVSALLEREDVAQEALWVCDASGDAELAGLARQFRAAPRAMPVVAGTVEQEMPWAADTSGFGISRLPETASVPPVTQAKPAGWLSPSRWLRGVRTGR